MGHGGRPSLRASLPHPALHHPPPWQAFLSGVPLGRLILLDLFSEETPLWQNFDGYFGHDWVWNALMVFGGRRGVVSAAVPPPTASRHTAPS